MNKCFWIISVIFLGMLATAAAQAGALASTRLADLQGTWLPDECSFGLLSWLGSSVELTDHTFRLRGYGNVGSDWTGTFELSGDGQVDLDVDAFRFSPSFGYPKMHVRGMYRRDGDRLSLCFSTVRDGERPKEIRETESSFTLSLVRAKEGFKDVPEGVTFKAMDAGGAAATGATVFTFINSARPAKPDGKGEWVIDTTQPVRPQVLDAGKTDGQGEFHFSYKEAKNSMVPQGVWDQPHKLIGLGHLSPAAIAAGAIPIMLVAQRQVHGMVNYSGVVAPGEPPLWRATYLFREGDRFAFCEAIDGKFRYSVPPGHYTLEAYGTNLQRRDVEIDVPTGNEDVELPPIELEQTALPKLVGKPAPLLSGVHGWKNTPVKLDELHGKVVLLCFWGYWCGPCVREMPTLMSLYDNYKDKGLAIVAVHVDVLNEINTAEKLDAHTVSLRKELWGGRDLPFSTALAYHDEPKKDGAVQQYGITSYPTILWIDRNGNVRGQIPLNDVSLEEAGKRIQELLSRK